MTTHDYWNTQLECKVDESVYDSILSMLIWTWPNVLEQS